MRWEQWSRNWKGMNLRCLLRSIRSNWALKPTGRTRSDIIQCGLTTAHAIDTIAVSRLLETTPKDLKPFGCPGEGCVK